MASERPPARSCTLVFNESALAECKDAALLRRDPKAAIAVARYYDGPLQGDRVAALDWYERAADLGSTEAFRKLFDAYYFGWHAPKNTARAEEYLKRAADAGTGWAQLVIAKRAENSEPEKAFRIYLHQGQAGNCYAQARLARAYVNGDLTSRSLTHAYFWQLLASVETFGRKFDGHPLLSTTTSISFGGELCIAVDKPATSQLERQLPPNLTHLVQQEATKWRVGQSEPLLPAFEGSTLAAGPKGDSPPATAPPVVPPSVASRQPDGAMPGSRMPQWTPLSSQELLPAVAGTADAATLFEVASRSVWLVVAAEAGDSAQAAGVALGSAVAVGPQTVLTNCHVVEGRPLVWIKQEGVVIKATVRNGDRETDRCVLSVSGTTLQPIRGMRRYANLRIGELVYTIGSPRGLERSLGQGLISGLRRTERRLLIQTTAQISAGSSGGGLFDQAGNLVGITTFRLRDSEGLNFAIAVEDYFRR